MNSELLKKHVNDWISRLGSQNRVAEKCGVSSTSLSLYLNGKYGAETEKLERQIATALNFKIRNWSIVTTITNYRKIEFVFNSCKKQSLWMAISNKAGSGKTKALEHLFESDITGTVVSVQAEEWNSRQFLLSLADKTCGIPKKGYTDIPTLIRIVTDYLNSLGGALLIVDEADKLKPSAFRKLIPIYNKTEDRVGCLLAGTENLKKEILRGVRNNTKGYDEIDSRLGRSYIELPGASEAEVVDICQANGLTGDEAAAVWSEVDKVRKPTKVRDRKGNLSEKMVFFCEDLRRLMRIIKREQLAKRA